MKKLLFAALVAAMALGIGATAYAGIAGGEAAVQPAAFSDIAGHAAEGELSLLGAMGTFTGDSGLGGAVKPDDPLTRAQFAKVIVSAIGKGSVAAGLGGLQPTFTDGASIPTWAWGYVNVAVYMGILSGYSDGSFGPNNPVTYAEAVTMLVRAIPGHIAQVPAGFWPYNYLFYAVDAGFTGSVDVGFANLPCTRGDMARLLVATMQQPRLDKEGKAVAGSAVLSDTEVENGGWDHEGNLYVGTCSGYNGSGVLYVTEAHGEYDVVLGDKVWLVGAADLASLMNLPVFAVQNADGGFFVWVTGETNVVTGVFKELADTDKDDHHDGFVLADGTVVPYAEDTNDTGTMVDGIINRVPDEYESYIAAGAELAITIGPDGLATSFIATEFNSVYDDPAHFFVVTDTTEAAADYDANDEETWTVVEVTDEGDIYVPRTCQVFLNGKPASVADIQENDVIDWAWDDWNYIDGPDGDYYPPMIIRVHREVVEGTVAGTTTTYGSGADPVDRVTITAADGSSKTYVVDWNGTIGSLPDPELKPPVTYGLDFGGNLLAEIEYTGPDTAVFIKSVTEYGDGTAEITVDMAGEERTFASEPGAIDTDDELNVPGTLEFDEDTRLVDDFTTATFYGSDLGNGILAKNAAGKSLTVSWDGEVDFFTNPAAYVVADGALTYVPFEDIGSWDSAPGHWLFLDDEPYAVRYYESGVTSLEPDGTEHEMVLSPFTPCQWFSVDVVEGHEYEFWTDYANSDPVWVDTYIHIFDSEGNLIESDDDDGTDNFSYIDYVADYTGTVYYWVGQYDSEENGLIAYWVEDLTE